MKVLVVDDSAATRFILGKMMRELGYEVQEASNGAEALTQLDAHPDTAIVLVDWNMPVMNGLEFVSKARGDGRFEAIKMVMVTTETEMENVIKALEAGANEYVMKPFTKEMIIEKLAIMGIQK